MKQDDRTDGGSRPQNDIPCSLQDVPPAAVSRPVTARGRRVSFREAMTEAEEQIMAREYFRTCDREHVRTVCQVMAEVYMMAPTALVKISGEEREAGMVADIFREMVEPETAAAVIEKIRAGALAGVRNTRPYIRAMLYNEAFDAEVKVFEEARARGIW